MPSRTRKWPTAVINRSAKQRGGLAEPINCRKAGWENASAILLGSITCLGLFAPAIAAASPGSSYLAIPTSIPAAVQAHLRSISDNATLTQRNVLLKRSASQEHALAIPFSMVATSVTLMCMQSVASVQVTGSRRYWA
jgi:hypothetical protein